MTTPDQIDPFVGWKGLLADKEGGLWSPSLSTPWPGREPLEAECGYKKHQPPHTDCMCGIYATKTYEDLKLNGYNWGASTVDGKVWVLAEIKLWGRVRPGRIGWRGQYAYPKTIYVPGHKVAPLGLLIKERYGVPLRIIDRFSGRRI